MRENGYSQQYQRLVQETDAIALPYAKSLRRVNCAPEVPQKKRLEPKPFVKCDHNIFSLQSSRETKQVTRIILKRHNI